MGLNRRVGLLTGLKYRGGGPMLAWILHRITGLSILLFVGLHVIASFFMQQMGSDWAIAVNTVYKSWIFQIFVVFFVLFHAINGFRIIILDFWPKFLQYQREALWFEWLVFLPIYSLTIFIIIRRGLGGG